ncbi:glycoprotease family-domain-containing protein [Aspergillus cavernicola]|uniref:N(6)-L-threonylcarbamoyladenine synthase n=1 Tax=Aspergillus cavernicola TaxID=176166 RepID=A0ABR4I8I5_9EURO
MLILRVANAAGHKSLWNNALRSAYLHRRGILTLAIETSCDDTSVAIVDKTTSSAKIHFLENITCDSTAYQGIHPLRALESHQENLASLVNKALSHLPRPESEQGNRKLVTLSDGPRQKPDFISATRGPGMRANLFVGLDTAKALSVAWQIPFVGVHHMQAHLLTPRLVSAVSLSPDNKHITPDFPFLSTLASGGHTLLVTSTSLTTHSILATTCDIALGEALDKVAREILPPSLLKSSKNTMYGKLLEQYAFPNGPADYKDYTAPRTRGEEIACAKRVSEYGWSLTTPLAQTRQLAFSFSFLATAVGKILSKRSTTSTPLSDTERVALAREAMRTCFEHLASRTVIALDSLSSSNTESKQPLPIKTLVVSGGVAANRFLMTVLRSFLDVRGFAHVRIVAPPPALCTDNAAMIGWAGIEMFEAGWRSELSVRALRKWSLDESGDGDGGDDGDGAGGVLGVGGWVRV